MPKRAQHFCIWEQYNDISLKSLAEAQCGIKRFLGLITADFCLYRGTHSLLVRFKPWSRLRRSPIRDRWASQRGRQASQTVRSTGPTILGGGKTLLSHSPTCGSGRRMFASLVFGGLLVLGEHVTSKWAVFEPVPLTLLEEVQNHVLRDQRVVWLFRASKLAPNRVWM
jgi:hypothetical protein